MAVEDKYVNSDRASGDKTDAILTGGGRIVTVQGTFEIAAADDDASVYRLFTVPSNAVPITPPTVSVVKHDNVTGGTDYEFGLYEKGVAGAAVDIDCFLGSTTFADTTDRALFSLADTVDNMNKAFWEYSSDTTDPGTEYDVAITANTVGSAAGTITYRAQYLIQG